MATKSIRLTHGTDTLLPESAQSGSGYQKCADGTLICWGFKRASISATSAWGGGYYGTQGAIMFPISFVSAPTVTATCADTDVFTYPVGSEIGTTYATIYWWRPSSGTVTATINWMAIGRWK